VFKSLIIVHLMIREGEPEVTLKYLAQNPHRRLAINSFTEGMFVDLFFLLNTWRLDMVIPSCELEPGLGPSMRLGACRANFTCGYAHYMMDQMASF
jgi:hypothetical protein